MKKKMPYENFDFSYLEAVVPNTDLIDNSFVFDYLITTPKISSFDKDYFDFSYLDNIWKEKD